MNTAMSTKRSFVSDRSYSAPHTGYALLALVGGAILLAAGIKLNLTLVAALGFVPFATAFLYYNGMFWAKRIDQGRMSKAYYDRKIPPFE